jgi:sulfur carrier protein
VKVLVNGEPVEIDDGDTVADLIARVAPERSGRGVAVAVNGTVVGRSDWPEASLTDDDRVEVLTAIGGG